MQVHEEFDIDTNGLVSDEEAKVWFEYFTFGILSISYIAYIPSS